MHAKTVLKEVAEIMNTIGVCSCQKLGCSVGYLALDILRHHSNTVAALRNVENYLESGYERIHYEENTSYGARLSL